MENPTNKNSKFLEGLQQASQEIEADIERKEPTFSSSLETKKENPKEAPAQPPLERSFDQDLVMKVEVVAKEKKRLEEIQKNLENRQKQVAECIQELTAIHGEISKVLEGKKKIDEDLRRIREKNKKFPRI